MKGNSPFFIALSLIGILIGIFLVMKGWGGEGIGPFFTLFLGIFVVIKEIIDMVH